MADPFPQLSVGSPGTPDDARFRIGQLKLWIEVGSSSTPFDVISVNVDYYLGASLPMAVVEVPLGTTVGTKATNSEISSGNTVQKMLLAFKKYTPIKIWAQFGSPELSESDIGLANESGKKLLLDGRVLGVSYTRAGKSVANLSVTCAHRMIDLATGSALFSKVVSGGSHDLESIVKEWGIKSSDVPVQHLVWEMIKQISAKLVATTDTTGKPRAISVLGGDAPAAIQKILEGTKRSSEFLNEITGYITSSYNDRTLEKIRDMYVQLVMSFKAGANYLNNLGLLGNELFFNPLFTANKGYMIPFAPCWNKASMKFLVAGSTFGSTLARLNERDRAVEYQPIAATIVGAKVSDYWDASKLSPSLMLGAAYVLPNVDPDFAICELEPVPSWADDIGLSPAPPQGSTQPSENAKAAAPMTASDKGKAATPDQGDTQAQQTTQARQTFNYDYARYHTLMRCFGGNSMQIECSMREYIVPGMNLGVSVGSSTSSGELITVYGHVHHVQLSISVSADGVSGVAVQRVQLTYVRNEDEQDNIVEKNYKYHFYWADAAALINDIKLWG